MNDEAVVLHTLTSTRGRTAVASGSYGTVVRLVRQALGLHQSHVASRSGYSQATISRIEQNQLRDPVVLLDLADALSIPRGIFGGRPDNDGLAGDEPQWLRFWGPGDLAIHEMHAARMAGRMPAAERAAHEALASADPVGAARNHTLYAAYLGNSLARIGKYEEAVAVSRDVLTSTARRGSQRVTAELRATARLLAGATYVPARDFAATIDRLLLPAV